MDCDYECPRCHNFFPLQNKIIHDIRCTEEKPMPLDINFQIKQDTNKGQQTSVLNETEKNEQESPEIVNLNKNEHINPDLTLPENQTEKNVQINPDFTRPENQTEKNNHINPDFTLPENQSDKKILDYSTLPENKSDGQNTYHCEICDKYLPEYIKDDHMYCHNLEKQEIGYNDNELLDQKEIEVKKKIEALLESQSLMKNGQKTKIKKEIAQQKKLEKQIQNEKKKNLKKQIAEQKRIEKQIQLENKRKMKKQIEEQKKIEKQIKKQNERHRLNPQNHLQNQHNLNMLPMFPMNQFNLNSNFFQPIMPNYDNPTSQAIVNSLPENMIEDVNKLDNDKKNCLICLEDYQNGDKTTTLPCIHLFHTYCILNWLKTKNNCPICKYKLMENNI